MFVFPVLFMFYVTIMASSFHYLCLYIDIQSITKQIATVKSIQLEFVKHSKLSRQNIKIEKEVEAIKEEQAPKSKLIKTVLQVTRAIAYVGLGIYLSREYGTLLIVDAKIFSPFMGSGGLIDITALYIIIGGAIAWRHLLRTLLNIFVSNPAIIP